MIRSTPVLQAFSNAAERYDLAAGLQHAMAWRLAQHCRRAAIPKGLWVDLGSGTGCLADALEATHPSQSVLRVDGSAAMLEQHHSHCSTTLHDLNLGLPHWETDPQLIASSFALHWLDNPASHLQHWQNALPTGGWLALAVPVRGSFPEWHTAAAQSGEPCTALPLPDPTQLLSSISTATIQTKRCLSFTQTAVQPMALLKPIQSIGASATPVASLSMCGWRRLLRAWPDAQGSAGVTLTWKILLLLLKR